MNIKYLALSALLVMGATQASQAADDVYFKAPVNFAGTGCAPGSISVTGENTSTLSILFSNYDAGKNAVSGLGRSSCNFAVPVQVPRGYQISYLTADWQGYAQGRGELSRKYFVAGSPNQPWITDAFSSASGQNFTKTDGMLHSTIATGCNGGAYNLRINSNLKAIGSSSYMAVDTTDLKNKVIFHLKYIPCH